tara:strand:- start:2092 stop:2286 length:195 start_codon:yes stop_codon:yes gene_type:complete
MNIVKMRKCKNCNQTHDCKYYYENQLYVDKLLNLLQQGMKRNVELLNEIEHLEYLAEIHPLEDK